MPLVDGREVLGRAAAEGFAIPALNFHSLDMVRALLEVAEAERSPLILQASAGTVAFLGFDAIEAIVPKLARRCRVPVVLHLDHARDYGLVLGALRHGFTSVMADGSSLSFEDNVSLTAKVVEAAHAAGVAVEGELGYVPRVADPAHGDADGDPAPGRRLGVPCAGDPADGGVATALEGYEFTLPEQAEEFVARTGVDSLAVAVGTVHGVYREAPRLDLERLAAIRARVPVPLVLHGGSGVPAEMLQAAIARGVAKVNFATELKYAWAGALRAALSGNHETDPRRLLAPALKALQDEAARKIRLCGSQGRA
ncbi:ketose-bisphosphate aldolase [Thermaerobacter marianensis DSM 12885]|uniref:Ketose-bisphosphate aldolase n=1 Tax=Thermaerobacter marianensis (strain ATCC 700841 / DSM 12885 / JCM 10246 / 7p75a) TaxID=644966 RepID=E6SID1_THEM7|nr:class II fructose-bisphosphate aldolase [Thermaerobacter marianensis]ADU51942.1 ketose-bisphosphate aldolase [Thermaerobacter marianensis DSM 12885]